MKKIKFNNELNALQFSNRVNGVQNFVNGKWEVEFSNVAHEIFDDVNCSKNNKKEFDPSSKGELEKIFNNRRKINKIVYTIKCYNQFYEFHKFFGEYSSYEEAEENLEKAVFKTDSVVEIFEIVKLYKIK